MATDKKIALCISGKPSCSMFCFSYIYDALLNNDLHIDVFIHTWENHRILDLYRPKKYQISTKTQQEVINEYLNSLSIPKNIKIEGSIPNIICEYYGLKSVFELVPNDYDYVIRCRFDLIIQNKFNLEPIISELNNDEYDIFSPDEVFNFGGYQNRILIGKYEAMKHAMCLLDNLDELMITLNRFHPESFLKLNLDNNNIRVHQKDINHRIVRDVSIRTNWPENPFKFLNL